MRTETFVCILLLCVSGTAAAQEWTEYVDTQNGFKLNFPGQPKVTETTWTSQMNYNLSARVYSTEKGRERYSLTVVDYSGLEQQAIERSKTCPPGNAQCRPNDGTGVGTALRVARRTRLGTFDGLLLESAVIDDCQGVAFAALLRAVHARREVVVHLRGPGGLGYLGLPRKIQLESVLRVDVLGPFLSSRGAGDTKQQNADECLRAHNVPSPAGFYFAAVIESTRMVLVFAS